MPHFAYSAFMLLALAVFLLARRCFAQPNVAPRHQLVLGLAAFVGGTFGAKLPFVLGLTGETGIAAVPHLHWGVYVHGVAVDPHVTETFAD